MANVNHTEMIEEDAADLQFPKDCWSCVTVKHMQDAEIFTSDPVCCICKLTLSEPYVKCALCNNIMLCPTCFSNGCEINNHKNDHDYIIIKNEFSLIENSNWTAREELNLLDIIQDCGIGNWCDISRRMGGKTPDECKTHYLNNYIDNQALPGLPKIPETEASLFGCEAIPYMFKLHDLEEPPRYGINTPNNRLLAGYNPARSDFEVNFDNHAELLISEMKYNEFLHNDDDKIVDYNLGINLQMAIIDSYNNRLKERARRNKIIRDHGLIAFRRTISWLNRYDATITRTISEKLLIFMQLVNGMEFDYIMEGLHHAGELRNYLNRLSELRKNGLTQFSSVPMYQKLLKSKQENDKERRLYMNNIEYSWRSVLPENMTNNSNNNSPMINSTFSHRKLPQPLEIKGMPGYDKLMDSERDLCSNARIVPESYLDFKQLLITENKKHTSLKLAQARGLLKIDVNKTRKIYDFLAEHGYINKPSQ
ncbi:hypothetical protein PV326_005386 [Microctonus aethiopoides]|nr:hypothetical protein PV326_005386 [Microctonus aethiopoides]